MSRKRRKSFQATAAKNDFRGMKPADRADIAVEMSSVVATITLESILDRNPRISQARLLDEARKRFFPGRRTH